jgi:hypothetical protein
MENTKKALDSVTEKLGNQTGAVGYLVAWLLGVPASILLLVFLFRAL